MQAYYWSGIEDVLMLEVVGVVETPGSHLQVVEGVEVLRFLGYHLDHNVLMVSQVLH